MVLLVKVLVESSVVQGSVYVKEPNFFAQHVEGVDPQTSLPARQGGPSLQRPEVGENGEKGQGDEELVPQDDQDSFAVVGHGDG